MTELKDNLLQTIEDGEVKMKPHRVFVLHAVLAIVGAILGMIILLFTFTFVVFVLRHTGVGFAPHMLQDGTSLFLRAFPWGLLLIAIIAAVVSVWLVKRFRWIYRKPFMILLVSILSIGGIGAIATEAFEIHDHLFEHAQERTVPVLKQLYDRHLSDDIDVVHPGVIQNIRDDQLRILTPSGEELDIQLEEDTKLPRAPLEPGDHVMIFGEQEDGQIEAEGIRPISKRRLDHVRRYRTKREHQDLKTRDIQRRDHRRNPRTDIKR